MHQQRPRVLAKSRVGGQKVRGALRVQAPAMLVDRLELLQHDLPAEQVQRLDLGRTLPQGGDTHVAIHLLRLVVLNVAMPAVDLDTEVGRLLARLRQEALEDGRQEPQTLVDGVCALLVAFLLHDGHGVRQLDALVQHRPPALRDRLLREQHRAHRRVPDDRVGDVVGVLGAAQRAHRSPLFGVPQRILEGQLRRGHALYRRTEARRVDEGKHVVEPAIFRADEPALRLLELDLARGRAVAPHLVFDARDTHAVQLAAHAVVSHLALGHEEQRDAFRPGRSTREACEDAVDHVLRQVMVAARDEDLGAGDAVGSVGVGLGLRGHLAQVGAALRLCEAHRAGELSRD
mmetsp:Transcript_41528/g.103227  ORF Transcript_41528/g.103227 Transcript_41528/m.103227 type:complete len:346 (-) Transcript_41528:548-1585(-)